MLVLLWRRLVGHLSVVLAALVEVVVVLLIMIYAIFDHFISGVELAVFGGGLTTPVYFW